MKQNLRFSTISKWIWIYYSTNGRILQNIFFIFDKSELPAFDFFDKTNFTS